MSETNNINKSISSTDSNSSRRNLDFLKMSDDETAKTNKITKNGWLLKWTNYLKGEWSQLSIGIVNRMHKVIAQCQ